MNLAVDGAQTVRPRSRSLAGAWPLAQAKLPCIYAAVFSDKDTRGQVLMRSSPSMSQSSTQGLWSATLFKQGTELVAHAARQPRDGQHRAAGHFQADPGLVASSPRAYLFRDAAHMKKFFASDVGREMNKMAEDQLGIKILGADLLRHAPGRPQAEEEDQDAGRYGRHQAAHARRRGLAVRRHGARRQPDADGLRRDLHRACRPAPSTARTTRCPTTRT